MKDLYFLFTNNKLIKLQNKFENLDFKSNSNNQAQLIVFHLEEEKDRSRRFKIKSRKKQTTRWEIFP